MKRLFSQTLSALLYMTLGALVAVMAQSIWSGSMAVQ